MIFISYRISDSLDLVGRLDADLARVFGADLVFRDKSRLQGGQDWTKELEQNAQGRPVMLVVIGETWQTIADQDGRWKGIPRLLNPDDWVRKEITFALDAGNVVIPVFLNGASMPPKEWLAHGQLDRLSAIQGEKIRSTEYAGDLANLIAVLRQQCPALPGQTSPGSPPAKASLPTPPTLYAVPNYILTSTFIGRATELDELDVWAGSEAPLLVVEGIGGLGKSALTWEWMQNRAAYAIPDLTGRVWWSFYERGASMASFVRHALAYITGQAPDVLAKETSHDQRCQDLFTELKKQPYLLVLDGIERILTAYQRWDKAQQRDDRIESDLRECVDPKDGDLLQQLLHVSPSKVMLSTRLFPHILEDRASGNSIPGVAHHALNGLSRADALAYFKHAGIKGNEQAMLEFADQFGRHSLLLKVVCGEIAQYPRRPFDFDTWRTDANYGGKLKLSELNLKQRYNHILSFSLEGLDDLKRRLLGRIAVLSENADYDTLAAINPYLPSKPEKVGSESDESPRAILAFDEALRELQDRGLLQWDRDTGRYDMHPVVRGHAAELLDDRDRKQTFLAARDYFDSLPPDDFETATELSHVAHSVEIYRCLLGAGLLDEAVKFYSGELSRTLLFHLGANTLVTDLLIPLFHGGQDGLPHIASMRDQSNIITDLAFAHGALGRKDESFRSYRKALQLNLNVADWENVASNLLNIVHCFVQHHLRAEASAVLALAHDLARVAGGDDVLSMSICFQSVFAIEQGGFSDVERLLADFHARPTPSITAYRPGYVECLSCRSQFFQGSLSEVDWRQGHELAIRHRNVSAQHEFLAIRGEWLLIQGQAEPALEVIDDALKIVNRVGTPKPKYHDLRAWALANLGRAADARAEITLGERHRFAAEAWTLLGNHKQARECALNGYRRAWGQGPPYILWYELERSRALLSQLGEPEPQLPAFDPGKLAPIPHEAEIRAAIAKLNAEKESRSNAADAS